MLRPIFWILATLVVIAAVKLYPWKNVDCKLVFNEIKLTNNHDDNFIELRKVCGEYPRTWAPTKVNDFILSFIDESSQNIIFSCRLLGETVLAQERVRNKNPNKQQLYVIGAKNVNNKQLQINPTQCRSTGDNNKFPVINGPMGIALFYFSGIIADRFIPERFGTEIVSKSFTVQIIEPYLHDYMIVGGKPSINSKLYQLYNCFQTSEEAVLSLNKIQQPGHRETSLNRCVENKESFVRTPVHCKQSPGIVNFCENIIPDVVISAPTAGNGTIKTVQGQSKGDTNLPRVASKGQPISAAGSSKGATVSAAGSSKGQTVSAAGSSKGQTVSAAGSSKGQTVSATGASKGQPILMSGSQGQPILMSGSQGQPILMSGSQGQPISTAGSSKGETSLPRRHDRVHGNCVILFNEIFLTKELLGNFIEIGKFCPFSSQQSVKNSLTLNGYILVSFTGDEELLIDMVYDLGKETLVPVPQPSTQNGLQSLYTEKNIQKYNKEQDVKLFMLLYFTQEEIRQKLHKDLVLTKHLDRELLEILQSHEVDILITGRRWREDINGYINLIVDKTEMAKSDFVLVPYRKNVIGTSKAYKSVSKCDCQFNSKSPESFKYSQPTAGQPNICDEKEQFLILKPTETFPFYFQGGALTTKAQQLVANLYYSQTKLSINPDLENLSRSQLVGKLLNISPRLVSKIWKAYTNKKELCTPGKKRKALNNKMKRIMSTENRKILRNCITGFYKELRVPKFMQIFNCFVTTVRERELAEAEAAGPIVDDDDDIPSLFSCHYNTFRKCLHDENYKFGKLNTRAVLVMDPKIVAWRGFYLSRIRLNDNLANPLPVLYLDES